MEVLTWIQQNVQGIIFAVTAVVAAASAITALTPTPKDDNFIKKIKDFLHILALNVGNSKPQK